MNQVRPTWSESRAILLPLGVTGVIALLTWNSTNPTANLWAATGFVIAFYAFVLCALFGAYGFIAHWQLRSLGPVLVCVPAIPIVFQWSPKIEALAFIIAFLGVAYLLSPDRGKTELEQSAQVVPTKWDNVSPLVDAYERTRSLSVRVAAFIDGTEAQRKTVTYPLPTNYVLKSHTEILETKATFDRELLPEIIKLLNYLTSQFGLVSATLDAGTLTEPSAGLKHFRAVANDLDTVAEKLKTMLIDTVVATAHQKA